MLLFRFSSEYVILFFFTLANYKTVTPSPLKWKKSLARYTQLCHINFHQIVVLAIYFDGVYLPIKVVIHCSIIYKLSNVCCSIQQMLQLLQHIKLHYKELFYDADLSFSSMCNWNCENFENFEIVKLWNHEVEQHYWKL